MKIILAPDKFKGCLSAIEVCDSIAAGLRHADSAVQIDACPMADGGEGTVSALVAATGGKIITRRVTGPLPEMKVDAGYGMLGDGRTAVVEMAAASGLALLRPEDRNPLNTTTFGTGELLVAAAQMGVDQIILGIGGSATCDAGVGCAQACGLPILMEGGEPVSPTEPLTPRDLPRVLAVKRGRGSPIERVKITVACDVANPLFGPSGAAPVYGPQKGATPEQVRELDELLQQFAGRTGMLAEAAAPGAGAAGGLGFGLLAFFNAELRSGIDIVIDTVRLRDRLRGADLCITGEGQLDAQSLSGKTAVGVARVCKSLGVPCIALVGAVGGKVDAAPEEGITAHFSICNGPLSLEQSMRQAPELLSRSAENLMRLIRRIRP